MTPEYFYSPDAPYVGLYSVEHILYLIFCFVAIFLFVKYHGFVRKNRDTIGKIMLGIILFQQVFLMYGWYIFCTDLELKEGLPLYICRISSLLSIWYLIRKDNRVMDVIFYFSIYALISLFYPMSVYHFLHVNGISYTVNHLMTVLIPIFGAIAYGWKPGWKAFLRASIAFTVYLPVVIVANALTGGNYFYLVNRPFFHDMPALLFDSLAYIVTIAGFALVTWLVEVIVNLVQKRMAERNSAQA